MTEYNLLQDLRAMSKSVMWLRHPAAIRTVMISPCPSNSLHAISGLDNGSIYRYAHAGAFRAMPSPDRGVSPTAGTCVSAKGANSTGCPWRIRVPSLLSIGAIRTELEVWVEAGSLVPVLIDVSRLASLFFPDSLSSS